MKAFSDGLDGVCILNRNLEPEVKSVNGLVSNSL